MPSLKPNDEIAYTLALLRVPGVGAHKFSQIQTLYPSLKQLFQLSRSELGQLNINSNQIDALCQPKWDEIEKDIAWATHPDHHLLTLDHPHYPPHLREINHPPPLLFAQGDLSHLAKPQLGIVGSRHPNINGQETAHQFAKALSLQGWVITSGLAMGIDTEAHRGALAAHKPTIAVLGSGLEEIYPKSNRTLAHHIIDHGVLLSELPPRIKPRPEFFPQRNRIISGLSQGIIVVQAALRSGSLITARYALEQGREVFAIPGDIHNPLSRGCNHLIRQGAKLVETTSDILDELPKLLTRDDITLPTAQESTSLADPSLHDLDQSYRELLSCINFYTTPVDEIITRSGLTAKEVSSMLVILEMQGIIASAPGGFLKIAT